MGDPVEDRRVTTADGTATSLNLLRGTGFAVLGVHVAQGAVTLLGAKARLFRQGREPIDFAPGETLPDVLVG